MSLQRQRCLFFVNSRIQAPTNRTPHRLLWRCEAAANFALPHERSQELQLGDLAALPPIWRHSTEGSLIECWDRESLIDLSRVGKKFLLCFLVEP